MKNYYNIIILNHFIQPYYSKNNVYHFILNLLNLKKTIEKFFLIKF